MKSKNDWAGIVLPLIGLIMILGLWTGISKGISPDLPSPLKTWEESKVYILKPFFKEGEMNQGMGRLVFYSLIRVTKGYA